ncbi:MAG: HIT domain-containing protein [Dehalococcoidia bacterium]|nr:HIT domain-containing protein [Dehalococcoidia bacterium]
MENIWAPWRMEYIRLEKPQGCILCDKPEESDDEGNYILYRGKKNYIIMNSYPYNPGHLLVAPYRHVAGLENLTREELHEHGEIIQQCIKVLNQSFNPAGFNIGTNMGRIAGAGIADHVHTHVVPRWQGDTNFMPVVGGVRVIPEAIMETYHKIEGRFQARPGRRKKQ